MKRQGPSVTSPREEFTAHGLQFKVSSPALTADWSPNSYLLSPYSYLLTLWRPLRLGVSRYGS